MRDKEVDGSAICFWQNGAIIQLLRAIAINSGIPQKVLDDIHNLMNKRINEELRGEFKGGKDNSNPKETSDA